jgi:hypothetical protein
MSAITESSITSAFWTASALATRHSKRMGNSTSSHQPVAASCNGGCTVFTRA